MLNLGVNIDHVATIREARKVSYPSPLEAALICEKAGAWGITAHLREDRRHIQDTDMSLLVKNVKRLNMEMAATTEMVKIACSIKPHSCCLVPEKREELTTEGGLDIIGGESEISEKVNILQANNIIVSLFIDPDKDQLAAAKRTGAEYIELHTGSYANATLEESKLELKRLINAAEYGHSIGLKVNAGHGIDYNNIKGILCIPYLNELNIGHSIVARAIISGMEQAVTEMVELIKEYT
jgi:pyridoxine 5-phosphate synthase